MQRNTISQIKSFFLGIFFFTCASSLMGQDRHFTVIIPSRNNGQWCERNLSTLVSQEYTNWHAIYFNDASTDDTQQKVEAFIKDHHLEDKIYLINNETRQGAMANMYKAIYMSNDWDVMVVYDGDDWLGRSDVFEILNRAYADENVWMTYGSYEIYPLNSRGSCAYQIPHEIIASNSYRQNPWCTSHMRTFYAWLFKCVKTEDFKLYGEFLAMTSDQAMMFPMLELSGGRAKYISDLVYIYNMENPQNDNKVDPELQRAIEKHVRSQQPYQPLTAIPDQYAQQQK